MSVQLFNEMRRRKQKYCVGTMYGDGASAFPWVKPGVRRTMGGGECVWTFELTSDMKHLILLLTLIASYRVLAQEGTGTGGSYQWVGPCCDASGRPSNPADPAYQVYTVKSFKKGTPVEIVLTSITIGSEQKKVDFKFKGNVSSETSVLQVTDNIGVKLVLAQMRENERNKYIYKLMVYRRDPTSECWRPLTIYNQMVDVYAQTISLSLYALGAEGTPEFVRIEDGWMKLN